MVCGILSEEHHGKVATVLGPELRAEDPAAQGT